VSYHCIDCYPKTKQITRLPLVSPHSGNGQLQGGNAICSREWLTGPPLVLLPRQEVTELLKRPSCSPRQTKSRAATYRRMAGRAKNLVQVFRTKQELHWVEFTF
jgi:hypothetical protein